VQWDEWRRGAEVNVAVPTCNLGLCSALQATAGSSTTCRYLNSSLIPQRYGY